jgi:hypothetical protein
MKQQQGGAGPSTSDFRDSRNDGAIRAKLGQALREQHDLMEPLPPGLVELLGRLEAGAGVRETPRARLYAAVDECVAAMVCAAQRKPRKPGGGVSQSQQSPCAERDVGIFAGWSGQSALAPDA